MHEVTIASALTTHHPTALHRERRDRRTAAAAMAALELGRFPGVLGVFIGQPRRGGVWLDEVALCVHVVKKHARQALRHPIPVRVAGFVTDVLPVGTPVCQSRLDTTDTVRAAGVHSMRRSTITAVSTAGPEPTALLCGHGALPFRGGRITRSGNWLQGADRPSFSVQDTGGPEFAGQLLRGEIAGNRDYAIGVFPGLAAERAFAGHLFARAPIPTRADNLRVGETVEHFGTVRHRALGGTVAQLGAGASTVELVMPDGSAGEYGTVLVVRSDADQDQFSLPGESGSLIFDDQRRAVGTVLGASADGAVSYVLELKGLKTAIGSDFNSFFKQG